MEDVGRRDAFKVTGRVLLAASAVSAAAEVDYGMRLGKDSPKLTPETKRELDKIAKEMGSNIIPYPAFSSIQENGQTHRPELNTAALANVLASLAYADGGLKEAAAVNKFISERKLIFGEMKEKGILSGQAHVEHPNSSDPSIKVAVNKELLQKYFETQDSEELIPIIHELYHVLQLGRKNTVPLRTQFMDKYGDVAAAIMLVSSGYANGTAAYKAMAPQSRNRAESSSVDYQKRKTLATFAGVATGVGTSALASTLFTTFVRPLELQAYIQAGGSVFKKDGILASNNLKEMTKSVIKFKEE